MADLSIISELDAIKRFELGHILQSYASEFVSPDKAGKVRVYDGNYHVDRDLLLDFSSHWPTDHVGMIVTGDLTVGGNVINANINSGPFLLVQGNLQAKNLVAGGAEIHVAKNATISELCIGEYNDGVLIIAGMLDCKLLIVDDHDVGLGAKTCPEWFSDIPPAASELRLSDYLDDEIPIAVVHEPYEYETVDVLGEIIPRILKGLPVVRSESKESSKKTDPDWLARIQEDPNRFDRVPKDQYTPEIAMVVVKYYGPWLEAIPEHAKTREVCVAAVGNNGMALKFVPDRLKDEALCRLAIDGDPLAIGAVPHSLLTEEMVKTCAAANGECLFQLPEKFRTPEIFKLAVRSCGDVLELMPEEQRTPEICLDAMHNLNFGSLTSVPRKILTEEMCIAAVSRNGAELKSVPDELRTYKVCMAAITTDGVAFDEIPEEHCDSAMLKAAVSSLPALLRDIHQRNMLTEELCEFAVSQFGLVLEWVPKPFLTERVCLAAVKDCDEAMRFVPAELRETIAAKVSS